MEELLNTRVITALKMAQKASDAPAIVYVVTESQISIRRYSNLEEVLEDIPEIEIQRKTNGTTFNFISIRGIGGNEKFIILMDGIRVNSTAGEPHYVGYNYSLSNNSSDNSFTAGVGNDDISLAVNGRYYHSNEADFPELYPDEYQWYNSEYKTNGHVLSFIGDILKPGPIEINESAVNQSGLHISHLLLGYAIIIRPID